MSASVPARKKRPDLFASADAFRERFEQGLIDLLHATGELGEDILVLANANFEPRIWDHLHEELRACFARLEAELAVADGAGTAMPGAPDDIITLREIIDHGFDTLHPPEWRHAGPWELQLNPLRAFRPTRHSNAAIGGNRAPFDAARFHFDKPFLRQEIFWQGEVNGRQAALFYNKFPFADYHGLLVPDLGDHRPQFLEPADFDFMWDFAQEMTERMPGFGLGYNSYGANASVNHLHFQTFLREELLPVENVRWSHNGGAEPYPCACHRFEERHEAAACINELHRAGRSYNLVLAGGSLYCLPRRRQGEIASAPWLGAMAWYELAGGFALARRADFDNLRAEEIAAQLPAATETGTSGNGW